MTRSASFRVELLIAELAARQWGLITWQQLLALGISPKQIRLRVAQGSLHLIYLNVYAVGHRRLAPRARMLAACLSCGPTSFLSHRAALAFHGFRGLAPGALDVSSPLRLRRTGLRLHYLRGGLEAGDVVERDGIRASSVSRALLELANTETTTPELERLLTLAMRKRVVDLNDLRRRADEATRRPGIAKLRTVLADYEPHPDRKSELERAFDRLIQGTRIPEPLRNVTIEGWEVDCYWPHVKLAVELDGRDYHLTKRDLDRDKYRDGKLALHGIRTVRLTGHRFDHEPRQIVADLEQMTNPRG